MVNVSAGSPCECAPAAVSPCRWAAASTPGRPCATWCLCRDTLLPRTRVRAAQYRVSTESPKIKVYTLPFNLISLSMYTFYT